MADYVMREMFDMNNTGESILYPQIDRYRMLSEDEFIDKMAMEGSGLSRGQVESMLSALKLRLSEMLGLGYTVKVKGIGTFSASLGIKDGKEPETTDEDETKRNAQSIEVRNVRFKADKNLIETTNQHCNLKRKGVRRLHNVESTEQERLAIAHKYLNEHPFMRITDYMNLTGLSRTKATTELLKFRKDATSGISTTGRGSHKLYVKAQVEE